MLGCFNEGFILYFNKRVNKSILLIFNKWNKRFLIYHYQMIHSL
jgi:hypothetical protein